MNQINRNNFAYHYVIGRGGFGKVWKVEKKKSGIIFAMKEMSKARVLAKRSVASVINERKLLNKLKHPFLVNMRYAFQDRETLYLVMDYLEGGDLRYHIGIRHTFTEAETKFILQWIVVGLEYMHNNSVIHRDIKPENLVLDSNGYVRLTDMGIARIWWKDNAKETSGTPGYMAPEVMCRQNHGFVADYFAVGVIGYEMMMGKRPYLGRSRKEIRDHIFAKQVQIKKYDLPEGWSYEAADFINKLLQRKPANRLGLNGPEEVKSHIWLKGTDWDAIINKRFPAPFIPDLENDNFDPIQANAIDKWNEENLDLLKQQALLLRTTSVQQLFHGYYYNNEDLDKKVKKKALETNDIKRPETAKLQTIKKHRKTFSLKW
jgi:serine/threonine protein kinase